MQDTLSHTRLVAKGFFTNLSHRRINRPSVYFSDSHDAQLKLFVCSSRSVSHLSHAVLHAAMKSTCSGAVMAQDLRIICFVLVIASSGCMAQTHTTTVRAQDRLIVLLFKTRFSLTSMHNAAGEKWCGPLSSAGWPGAGLTYLAGNRPKKFVSLKLYEKYIYILLSFSRQFVFGEKAKKNWLFLGHFAKGTS